MSRINTDQLNHVGVIVGRFQTPWLTPGHQFLLDEVLKRHVHVLVCLGVSPGQPTDRNPLDYETRSSMLRAYSARIQTISVLDHKHDQHWSRHLDQTIRQLHEGPVTLYGSRDSFIQYYQGELPTVELESSVDCNASMIRQNCRETIRDSIDFRRGVIYGLGRRFKSPYLAVDIALIKEGHWVLLGRKPQEDMFQFPGGFVDSGDGSILQAAARELKEETGISGHKFKLIGEARIDDWRYRHDEENIFTNLFVAEYWRGTARPQDDLAELRWFPIHGEIPLIAHQHKKLLQILIKHQKYPHS